MCLGGASSTLLEEARQDDDSLSEENAQGINHRVLKVYSLTAPRIPEQCRTADAAIDSALQLKDDLIASRWAAPGPLFPAMDDCATPPLAPPYLLPLCPRISVSPCLP